MTISPKMAEGMVILVLNALHLGFLAIRDQFPK